MFYENLMIETNQNMKNLLQLNENLKLEKEGLIQQIKNQDVFYD